MIRKVGADIYVETNERNDAMAGCNFDNCDHVAIWRVSRKSAGLNLCTYHLGEMEEVLKKERLWDQVYNIYTGSFFFDHVNEGGNKVDDQKIRDLITDLQHAINMEQAANEEFIKDYYDKQRRLSDCRGKIGDAIAAIEKALKGEGFETGKYENK